MKIFIFISCISFITILLNAQLHEPATFVPAPPSPTMSSLGAYANIPVDKYTGVPSISIPMYTIKSKSMALPLSISYHASGIRVEQEASTVGLGWALNAGGIITRQIRGQDDFSLENVTPYFSINKEKLKSYTNTTILQEVENFKVILPCKYSYYINNNGFGIYTIEGENYDWKSLFLQLKGSSDGEPDIFYLNFSEGSFQFIIDSSTEPGGYKIKLLGNNDFIIELANNDKSGKSGFVVTTKSGTKYLFSKVEYQQTHNGFAHDGKKIGNPGNLFINYAADLKTQISGWFLTKITDRYNNEIHLEYNEAVDYIEMLPSREQYVENYDNQETTTDRLWKITKNWVKECYISKIYTNNITANFIYESRDDIDGSKALQQITISNSSNSDVLSFNFHYNYFNGSSDRLKLEKLTKTCNNLSQDYAFYYYGYTDEDLGYPLPPKDSYAQDFWGYYNGALSNTGLLTNIQLPYVDSDPFFRGSLTFDANRDPDETYAKSGVLSKIEYPLGYTVRFEYEMNQFLHPIRSRTNNFFPPNACSDGYYRGGGLRIKKIYYSDNNTETADEYEYIENSGETSGELLRGNELYYCLYIYTGQTTAYSESMERLYVYRTSAGIFASGFSAGGAHVGYSKVTVSEGNNSMKVFNYITSPEEYFGAFSVNTLLANMYRTMYYFVPNLMPIVNPKNGQLTSEEWYGNSFVKKIDYQYLDKSEIIKCYAPIKEIFSLSHMGVEYERILPNYLLEKKTITGPDVLNTEETYTYNDYDLVTSVSTVESNGSKKKKEIIYNSDFQNSINGCISYYTGNKTPDQWKQDWIFQCLAGCTASGGNATCTSHCSTGVDDAYESLVSPCYTEDLSFLPLRESNITNSVIEQRELVEKNGTTIITGASYLKYKDFNGKISPSEQYLLSNTTPTNTERVSISGTYTFSKNPAYKLQYIFDAYDSYSNLLQMHRNDGNKTSYIWGYNGEYAVATINNASNNDAAIGIDCGYTGFESGVAGNNANNNYFENFEITTSEHKTGNYSSLWNSVHPWNFQRSFNVSNSDGKYIYSAWVKVSSDYIDSKAVLNYSIQYSNGTAISEIPATWWVTPIKKVNGWQYVEIEINLKAIRQTYNYTNKPVRINVVMYNGQSNNIIFVDDIRFQPVDAQMTTYTYDPLYGSVTSVTDANNKTTTYEYDDFGKLLRVRDFKGKLIKENLYNYKKYPITE